ncbi:MerC domain-containing protein [Altererythrobacter sp. KTW20L]|uniref:MerC domain-containing protein n=1 Tax=Altererythrobacter sp. KTW20L TaxID=2942210 RepID=UPI0020C0AB04|nr:MerC domain-containing protein [Altererythrobacter sp. KTW20L]MCL6249987.1 MerC domain-containing protein [Altererythrobacter sp. KTW20L]
MSTIIPRIREGLKGRMDRLGVLLSCLCLLHCVVGLILVAGMGAGASFLLDPAIHKYGLLLATIVAGAAIGLGAIRHRRAAPFVVAMTGLSFMGGALAVGHGYEEAVLTVIGVVLVAAGHVLNLRKA